MPTEINGKVKKIQQETIQENEIRWAKGQNIQKVEIEITETRLILSNRRLTGKEDQLEDNPKGIKIKIRNDRARRIQRIIRPFSAMANMEEKLHPCLLGEECRDNIPSEQHGLHCPLFQVPHITAKSTERLFLKRGTFCWVTPQSIFIISIKPQFQYPKISIHQSTIL